MASVSGWVALPGAKPIDHIDTETGELLGQIPFRWRGVSNRSRPAHTISPALDARGGSAGTDETSWRSAWWKMLRGASD